MSSDVNRESAYLWKGLITLVAYIWSFTSVYTHITYVKEDN